MVWVKFKSFIFLLLLLFSCVPQEDSRRIRGTTDVIDEDKDRETPTLKELFWFTLSQEIEQAILISAKIKTPIYIKGSLVHSFLRSLVQIKCMKK